MAFYFDGDGQNQADRNEYTPVFIHLNWLRTKQILAQLFSTLLSIRLKLPKSIYGSIFSAQNDSVLSNLAKRSITMFYTLLESF
jgi:hypothetical protein